MSTATASTQESCPHELRPGTTVCLHCARADRLARRQRTRRNAGQAAAAAIAVLGLAGIALPVGRALAGRASADAPSLATVAAEPSTPAAVAPVAVAPAAAAAPAAPGRAAIVIVAAPTAPAATPSAPAAVAPAAAATAAPAAPGRAAIVIVAAPTAPAAVAAPAVAVTPAHLRIPEGHTTLAGGMLAERHGDTVLVSFDTPLARTRKADKFDRIVRATLPALYGEAADSALARVPVGTVVSQAELVGRATVRGVRVPLSDGRALALRPETRPGRDGPLVVRYAVTLADAGPAGLR